MGSEKLTLHFPIQNPRSCQSEICSNKRGGKSSLHANLSCRRYTIRVVLPTWYNTYLYYDGIKQTRQNPYYPPGLPAIGKTHALWQDNSMHGSFLLNLTVALLIKNAVLLLLFLVETKVAEYIGHMRSYASSVAPPNLAGKVHVCTPLVIRYLW